MKPSELAVLARSRGSMPILGGYIEVFRRRSLQNRPSTASKRDEQSDSERLCQVLALASLCQVSAASPPPPATNQRTTPAAAPNLSRGPSISPPHLPHRSRGLSVARAALDSQDAARTSVSHSASTHPRPGRTLVPLPNPLYAAWIAHLLTAALSRPRVDFWNLLGSHGAN